MKDIECNEIKYGFKRLPVFTENDYKWITASVFIPLIIGGLALSMLGFGMALKGDKLSMYDFIKGSISISVIMCVFLNLMMSMDYERPISEIRIICSIITILTTFFLTIVFYFII